MDTIIEKDSPIPVLLLLAAICLILRGSGLGLAYMGMLLEE